MKVKNFSKKVEMERVIPEFQDKMTKNQFAFIMNLRKKQIGKVKMNYEEMKKYMTKKDATKLIDLLTYEYYDIDVILRGSQKPKPIFDKKELEKQCQTQKTMTQLDMLETQLSMLNKQL
jgi:mevalonate pyrophosphate decarboxylase